MIAESRKEKHKSVPLFNLSLYRDTHSRPHRRLVWWILAWGFVHLLFAPAARAQTFEDGLMVPRNTLYGGYLYTYDSWDEYWQGTKKRSNGNIGTLTTQTQNIFLNYGLLDRLDLMGSVSYVQTNASKGVLASQQGWQDFTVAAKYRLPGVNVPRLGRANFFAVPFGGAPTRDYTPDFLPLSIGSGAWRAGIRSTVNVQSEMGLFVNVTGAYTWRGDVHLDRPYYFTNDRFFFTNVVPLPRQVDYSVSGGYLKRGLMTQFTFTRLVTQGGITSGDVRRQDMPFVSNRFISSRVGGLAQIPIPWVRTLAARVEYSYVIDGRNVGQSSTFSIGLMKTQSLRRRN